jgi:ribonuclease HI
MDEGQKSGVRNQGAAVQQASKSAGQRAGKSAGQPAAADGSAGQVLEGYVKNGVVHLLEGELPEGAFVRITRR